LERGSGGFVEKLWAASETAQAISLFADAAGADDGQHRAATATLELDYYSEGSIPDALIGVPNG